ncbi:hypothetical protein [Streptomyces cucumeris]|uniref:hypothetical protein n=1 Tax=Streptomyces cucumeris TaxID=2962890 RepID=UPI0020C91A4A|nr:hypothetical protein [Streptomyces sp. NEAU-Y11]MCP9205962.1 hypothetical protein [Streptomyces sp. NEAU-Y11]
MGVDVILVQVRQKGSSPKGRQLSILGVVSDNSDSFAKMCDSSGMPTLQRVDPYGSLILTAQQMDQFLTDVAALRKKERNAAHGPQLERIESFARRCADDASLELHLEGD